MCSENRSKLDKLLLDVRSGDDDACAELIRTYSPLISGLVRCTMAKMPPSARIDEDELLQEAAIKLYQAALSYEGGDVSFGLYAKICIKNRMVSLLRSHSGGGEISFDEITDELPDPEDRDPSHKVLERENEHELDMRIRRVLSPLEYDVFNLYIDGVRTTEIAKALSVSTKTAENAVYRMRSKIQKLLY